jgi:NAD(P)-dependent dehydrogenase (short-subunit alcohol dehydrogenase family)
MAGVYRRRGFPGSEAGAGPTSGWAHTASRTPLAKATGADTIRETASAGIATGRFTTPQEVATLVTLLASDRTANVTGVNYVIDGGLIKTT